MQRLKFISNKIKITRALMLALFCVFLTINVYAIQANESRLTFNATSFEFSYDAVTSPSLLTGDSEPQFDIAKLINNLNELTTEKSYFDLTYGYIKNYGRAFKENIDVELSAQQLKITSLAPIRSLMINQHSLPLHPFVSLKMTAGDERKTIFSHLISEKVLSIFCLQEQPCNIVVTDITGATHSTLYQPSDSTVGESILGFGFYGLPCLSSRLASSCIVLNSQSLSVLAELLTINVVDVSKQQLIFNEQILCESGVLKNCQHSLAKSKKKNTLEWQVMENQLVIQLQTVTKQQRFYQAEVLIAWVNPMMNETRNVTTVFARHKNQQRLIEVLAKKIALLTKIIIAS